MPVNIHLEGVWDDGAGQACSPCSHAQTLKFPKRADVLVDLTVKDLAGVLVDLTSDPTTAITLTARRQAVGADVVFPPRLAVIQPLLGDGRASITIPATDTASVEPGRYVFDVWMQRGGDQQPLMPVGAFELLPSAFQAQGSLPPGQLFVLTPPQLSATENNYGPANWLLAQIVRFLPAAGDSTMTGMVAEGLAQVVRSIVNVSDVDTLTLAHEDGGSSAANRFKLVGASDVVLGPGESATLFYDVILQRWTELS